MNGVELSRSWPFQTFRIFLFNITPFSQKIKGGATGYFGYFSKKTKVSSNYSAKIKISSHLNPSLPLAPSNILHSPKP